MNIERVTRFTVTPAHWPAIVEPTTTPSGLTRYKIGVPADEFPEVDRRNEGPLVVASSAMRPALIPDFGSETNFQDWENLHKTAIRWGYKLDHLLYGREVVALCELYTVQAGEWAGKWRQARILPAIKAIRILGEISYDEGLQAHIDQMSEKLK